MQTMLWLGLLIGCGEPGSATSAEEIDTGGGPVDGDGDGFRADEDCDDGDATIHPDAVEVCDGIDNNCDARIDEGLERLFYADRDGDGYGDPDDVIASCEAPPGFVSDDSDCNDAHAADDPEAWCWEDRWSGEITAGVLYFGERRDCRGTVVLVFDFSMTPVITGSGTCVNEILGEIPLTLTGDVREDELILGQIDVPGLVSVEWEAFFNGEPASILGSGIGIAEEIEVYTTFLGTSHGAGQVVLLSGCSEGGGHMDPIQSTAPRSG